jgi:competence protein ComEC
VHILAISGFNVGIVIFIVLILLKFLRISRIPRVILTILFIIIYAIITGSQPSVIRASIMAIVILIGILLQRESDIYNSVSFAAIIILMLNPKALFDVGFQLSFLSVISIVWLEPKIEKPILKLFNSKSKALILVVRSLSVSLAAWLGVAGLVLYYFSIFSPVTILANLFIVPFSSLIVALGFCLIILGGIFPAIAFIFSGSLKLCLDFLVYAVWLFHRLPASFFYLRPITIYQVLGYYLILFTISYLIRPPNAKVVE